MKTSNSSTAYSFAIHRSGESWEKQSLMFLRHMTRTLSPADVRSMSGIWTSSEHATWGVTFITVVIADAVVLCPLRVLPRFPYLGAGLPASDRSGGSLDVGSKTWHKWFAVLNECDTVTHAIL